MKVLCYRVENTNKTIVILNTVMRMLIKGMAPFVVMTDLKVRWLGVLFAAIYIDLMLELFVIYKYSLFKRFLTFRKIFSLLTTLTVPLDIYIV
jgi:hypothetical protein